MKLEIVGAGMAGLLAARMLQHRQPIVYEKQKGLPNNHSAVLRFRTPQIGDVLGIEFKKVKMIKYALPWLNPVADALAYSYKNNQVYRSDRSVIDGLVASERWIAPPDLIQQMADPVRALFDTDYEFYREGAERDPNVVTVSTIPMPLLMDALQYPLRDKFLFNWMHGVNVRAAVARCDAYVSILVTDPGNPISRVSLTGNELIVEIPGVNASQIDADDLAREACTMLGISSAWVENPRAVEQRYAKIAPVDDYMRKEFIHWATDKHGVFSLGRFATWRPGLLLDDLVNDVRLIDKWIASKDRGYKLARHR